jgi:hypothetical protein
VAEFNELTAQVLSQTAGAARHQNHFLLASIVLVADGVGTQVVLYDAETALGLGVCCTTLHTNRRVSIPVKQD